MLLSNRPSSPTRTPRDALEGAPHRRSGTGAIESTSARMDRSCALGDCAQGHRHAELSWSPEVVTSLGCARRCTFDRHARPRTRRGHPCAAPQQLVAADATTFSRLDAHAAVNVTVPAAAAATSCAVRMQARHRLRRDSHHAGREAALIRFFDTNGRRLGRQRACGCS
jgi:hypothetical protein